MPAGETPVIAVGKNLSGLQKVMLDTLPRRGGRSSRPAVDSLRTVTDNAISICLSDDNPEGRVLRKRNRSRGLPAILVTGASGLVGGNFVNAVKDNCIVYAISRRRQIETDVPPHDNIHWLYCDIGDAQKVADLFVDIAAESPIDFLFHFAGYYDFTNRESPEYLRTNINGTLHVLENAARFRLKRFVFSSSLAVTDYTVRDTVLTEKSPPDAEYPYAVSKRESEKLVAGFSGRFPCTIARLAAVYSDWCEYGPLYSLLKAWTGNWRSQFIAGKGTTALPYIHVEDLNRFFIQIMKKNHALADRDILLASPSGCVSHDDLHAAVRRYTNRSLPPRHVPSWLAALGVLGMQTMGLLTRNPPFERLWMMRYLDREMKVNAAATHSRLDWAPKPRFHVTRRLLFLIEKMKSNPLLWHQKNLVMTRQVVFEHSGLKIHNAMQDLKTKIIDENINYLRGKGNGGKYPHYRKMDAQELRRRIELIWLILEASLRLGDRMQVLTFANQIAHERCEEGICFRELTGALKHLASCIERSLNNHPALEDLRPQIHNDIVLTMQLIMDEIENVYDTLKPGRTNPAD